MVRKTVSTLPVITVKTRVEASGFEGVGEAGPRYARGIGRLGTVGKASDEEKKNPTSDERGDVPDTLVFLFTVATTVSVFGSFTVRFVANVFPVIVANVGGNSSGAPGRVASVPLSFRSVARRLAVVLTVSGSVTLAVLRAGSAVTPALPSKFISAVLSAVNSPMVVADRRTATVAPKESNRGKTGRRFRRAACLFGKAATTLVVPLMGSGVRVRQQSSSLLSLLTEKASEAQP